MFGKEKSNAASSIMENEMKKGPMKVLKVSTKIEPVNPDSLPVEMRDAGDIPQPDEDNDAAEDAMEMSTPKTKEELLAEVQSMEIKSIEDLKKIGCMINNLAFE